MRPQINSVAATTVATLSTSDQRSPSKGHRAAASDVALREYLLFRLGADEYGIDNQRVQELRAYEAPLCVGTKPACVTGVVNLRGVIVPIVDLRLKLDLANADCDRRTAVIVLKMGGRTIGLVVDAVAAVITLTQSQLLAASAFNPAIESDHLLAIAMVQGRILRLLDIEKLLSGPDLGLVEPTLQ